jgi:ribosome maturation factor RimP
MIHLSLVSAAPNLRAASTQPTQDEFRQRVEQFGIGTELKLKLQNGEKLRGAVESIGTDSFVLVPKDEAAPREVAFHDLKSLRYPSRGYEAQAAPDPLSARRMVVQLGVGEHIMVKLGPEQKVRGHIREIHDDHFVVLPDGQSNTIRVPYDSVWKVNKNLSFGATIAIVVGIAAAVVLILVLSGEDEIDVLPN